MIIYIKVKINPKNIIKIIVILVGDMGVGKSSLLSKYVKGVVPVSPLPTIAIEFATKIIQIKEGGYIKAQIWDTAGQEKYKAITSHHYRRAVGALIVYDVTKRSSFDNVLKWFSDLKSKAEKECIIALIGNKIDLLDRNSRRREISYEEGMMLAANNNMLFYETSAYTSVKVNDAFEDLLQEIYNERRRVNNSNKSNGSTKILSLNNNDGNENRNCC